MHLKLIHAEMIALGLLPAVNEIKKTVVEHALFVLVQTNQQSHCKILQLLLGINLLTGVQNFKDALGTKHWRLFFQKHHL